MFDAATLLTFLLASSAIIIAPGPAQALVLARTLSEGRRAGFVAALGLNVGTLVHAAAAGAGVSAVLARSALAFDTLKYAGAIYLCWLGVQAWRRGAQPAEAASDSAPRALARAIATGVMNPKIALFFLAFLPQFVDPTRGPVLAQCLTLGVLLAAMDLVYESGLVWVSASLAAELRDPQFDRWRNRLTGGVLVGLGVRLAFADRR